jgi:hypothetical protein
MKTPRHDTQLKLLDSVLKRSGQRCLLRPHGICRLKRNLECGFVNMHYRTVAPPQEVAGNPIASVSVTLHADWNETVWKNSSGESCYPEHDRL